MSLPSGLPETATATEPLARFLRSGSHVAKSKNVVKPAAFLPAPDDDTSVFRIEGCDDGAIRRLATEHVGDLAKHGTAKIFARHVIEARLQLVPEEPPDRHANIRGWPKTDDAEAQKQERKTRAAILSAEASWLSAGQ